MCTVFPEGSSFSSKSSLQTLRSWGSIHLGIISSSCTALHTIAPQCAFAEQVNEWRNWDDFEAKMSGCPSSCLKKLNPKAKIIKERIDPPIFYKWKCIFQTEKRRVKLELWCSPIILKPKISLLKLLNSNQLQEASWLFILGLTSLKLISWIWFIAHKILGRVLYF
jgi:hypothetical protein